ncbi:hydrogenase expression protein HupH [Clostridium botulinum]|uniref:hydrogenase maturation nickel metallochaperone HypA n=1 Tax=Clostridium botulinum TaxID=1491 RepID=UPI0006A6A14D|nr:hydrogenase maturation nickel metallochaperone HypA [Clostridium botulinum]KEI79021.1 hydrogenase expression protein HupH [Clostridium botulinum A2 117]KEI81440.1 hydrogenase expression protein HupH [Clostridium botulinum B2 331]KOM97899.1 hydrogenase expression protein HupH [Clostridium botulinum]KON01401.1 hydrogenase expression protein HupH [Clostridium botulinum]MBN3416255.1 hydrogenase maturation nickel metallochaperone HypA [Clostridium botulinum]
MHDTAVICEVVDIVLKTAKDNFLEKITKVILHIGEFSCIQEDQLKFSYKIISKDTLLEGSDLIIEWVKPLAYCSHCNETFPVSFTHKECPICHKVSEKIVSGYDTYVYSIEGD